MAANVEILIRLLFSFFLSLIVSATCIKFIIKKEKKAHLGQAIREDIVQTHQKKQGTPTMGGVGILLGAIVGGLINFKYLNQTVLVLMALVVAFFIIGFIDDYQKIKQKNSRGLSASLRFGLEIVLALGALLLLNYQDKTMWNLHLPNLVIYLGPFFLLLAIFMIVGSANAVNMTDGLDGLAGGLLLLAYLPFLLLSLKQNNFAVAFLIAAFMGGNVGFLWFNANPAKIFMGDAGSLTNGCFLAVIAFITGAEYLLCIAGGLFIIETISVILQVGYYKATHKRIFKMAPLHHHFEMLGMKEYQVVNLFYLLGFVLTFVSLLLGGVL